VRRFFSSIRNVGILAILLFSCVVVSAAPVKVRLAYPARSMSTLHIPVALEKGIFAKYGLNVEAIQIRSAVSLSALLSNEIQYMTAIGTGIRAAAKGLPVKGVVIYRDAPDQGLGRPISERAA
jgi:ABC-type nitrate/sulfonate/bicarbonate transport system substrate-binding protein